METFVLLLAPYAPHIAEELWSCLGHNESLAYAPWPQYSEAALVEDEVEILVQIGGKPRVRMQMPSDADAQAMQELAFAHPDICALIAGREIVKVIAVPGRLVNIVVK